MCENVVQILELEDSDDVLDVSAQSDLLVIDLRALAHAAEGWRENVVSAFAKRASDVCPFPAAAPATMHNQKGSDQGSLPFSRCRHRANWRFRILRSMDDERPPICPACGVTMIPADLSAHGARQGDWICSECEETRELEPT